MKWVHHKHNREIIIEKKRYEKNVCSIPTEVTKIHFVFVIVSFRLYILFYLIYLLSLHIIRWKFVNQYNSVVRFQCKFTQFFNTWSIDPLKLLSNSGCEITKREKYKEIAQHRKGNTSQYLRIKACPLIYWLLKFMMNTHNPCYLYIFIALIYIMCCTEFSFNFEVQIMGAKS